MLVEYQREDALKKFRDGKKVIVVMQDGDGKFETKSLDELLPEGHYLVDVPAIENPDFKQAVADMMSENNVTHGEHPSEDIVPVLDDPLPVPQESTPSKKSGGGKKSAEKKALIKSLVEQGLNYREISEQTGIPYGTVSVYGKEFKGKQETANTEPEDNTDGHLCKTCKYRGKGASGCDYIILKGHSRGCAADRCTVYEKGPRPASTKQTLSL